jgi:hypothetical protein
MTQFRQIRPEDNLLRALLNRASMDYLPNAFLLRVDEKDTGLSVNYDSTVEVCRRAFKVTYGVAQIRASVPIELSLDVVPDGTNHANIRGIPHKDDDALTAEWIASRLAEKAEIVATGKLKTVG